jgi:peptidyl-tRNA hydrolase
MELWSHFPSSGMKVAEYGVQDFSTKERQEIDVAVQESISVVEAIFKHGMERAVSGMR